MLKGRRREIRKRAEAVRVLYELRGAANLEKILTNENIKLLSASNLDKIIPGKSISGILSIKDGEKKIYINKAHAETRNKFTIGHELGHYFLHRNEVIENNGQLISFRGNVYDVKEAEADLFSAELLMPRKELYAYAQINKEVTTQNIAEYFEVSLPAISKRIDELNKEAEEEAKELW